MKLQVFLGFLFIAKCSAEINFMLANATAEVGSDATIPCTYEATGFEGMVPTLRWYAKKGAARTRLYVFVQDDDTRTFKASGVPRNLSIETDGSLIIPGVNLADNADFSQLICEVDFGAGGSAEGVLDFSVYAFPNTEPVTERFASEFDMSTTLPIPRQFVHFIT
uniref:Ig-like domain-containing protein n=1 Tax=Ciona savignyi TaxID=51511 RepID=H2YIY1_CIOSA